MRNTSYSHSHVVSYFTVERTPQLASFNYALKSVRISIEWNYGATATDFAFLKNTDKLRLMESSNVAKVYTVATLFRNFKVGLYGSQTSNYFNIVPPADFIEKYVHQKDR